MKNEGGEWGMVNLKYKKLSLFRFVCGLYNHSKQKCEVRFSMQNDDGVRGLSGELRDENKGFGRGPSSQWLKE